MDRISSPEQLNEYIKVVNPGVWLILIGIIVLLIGVCVWGFVGRLESSLKTPVLIQGNMAYTFVTESDIDSITPGSEVNVEDKSLVISDISNQPILASSLGNDYFLYVGELEGSEWLYPCSLTGDTVLFEEGVYSGKIVLENVAPMSFVTN